MATSNSNIPYFTAYLKSEFLYDDEVPPNCPKYVLCEVFGINSLTRRCLTFHVMTEFGSRHDRVPIHYLVNEMNHANLPLDWLQLWDCYSPNVNVTVWEYHKNSSVKIQLKNKKWVEGKYLFIIDWFNTPEHPFGYAEMQGGNKCGHVIWGIKDEEGNPINQLFCQPNNRIIWQDGGAFITKELPKNPGWQVFHKEFTCEGRGRWVANDDYDYFYQFSPKNEKSKKKRKKKVKNRI